MSYFQAQCSGYSDRRSGPKNPQFLGEKQQLDTKVYLLNTWSFIFFLPLGPFFKPTCCTCSLRYAEENALSSYQKAPKKAMYQK